MKLSKKEIDSVIGLPASKRYEYFIKKSVGWGEFWGLYDDGWALVSDEGQTFFPLWPAADYAELCANKLWESYKPKSIELDEFLEVYVPDFEKNNIQIAVFMTVEDKAVTVSLEEFTKHLDVELSKY